jgi:hypothetical protein
LSDKRCSVAAHSPKAGLLRNVRPGSVSPVRMSPICQLGREYPLRSPGTVRGPLDRSLANVLTDVRQSDCSRNALWHSVLGAD